MVCLSCGYLSKGIHFLCSYFRIGGASIIAHTAHQINEEIHDKEVRLISAQGEQLGIMPLAEAMAKATYDHFGRIDGLVNNAALQKQWMLDEYPIKDYDLLMHVNLGGYINMMRAVLPYLKETRGSITCISSVHGKRPTDFDPVYAMTKGGMHMLLREAAIEFAKYGVRVNMIMPAGVKIEFKTGNPRPFQKPRLTPPREYYEKYPMYPLGRHGLPEDSGWACVYLASQEAEHISGACLRADGCSMLL